MITEHMQLTTRADANVWAANFGVNTAEGEARLAEWIWKNKPAAGCTLAEHPVSRLNDDEFWEIVGE